jgi:acyl dehydratase
MGADYASAVSYAKVGDGANTTDWIGRVFEVDAPFPVEAGRVADFCSLVEDANPIYWDRDLAIARYGAPIAPPAMMTVWRQPSPWNPIGIPPHGPTLASAVPLPADTLVNAGFSCAFSAPARVGDRLRYIDQCVSITGPKTTGLGVGYFVRNHCVVVNQDGLELGTYTTNQFRYRKQEQHVDAKALPTKSDDVWSGPNDLPDIAVPLTPTFIALLTAGTRDYFPGHHDDEYAREQGAPGAYPNTNTYCGLVDRVATEWAGYRGTIKTRDLQMFAQAKCGMTLHSRGRVLRRTEQEADMEVRLVTADALIASASITLTFDIPRN